MSRVYFHSEDDRAAILGSERAWLYHICKKMSIGLFNIPDGIGDQGKALTFSLYSSLPESSCIKDFFLLEKESSAATIKQGEWLRFKSLFECYQSVSDDKFFDKIPIWLLWLNTACLVGNDAIKLAARIYGQCECHCWVRGENKKWLAAIIEKALATHLYRRNSGWEDVVELLNQENDSPVVLSYSVCDSFPNATVAGWGVRWEKFEQLEDSEKWLLAVTNLEESGRGLELAPQTWDDFYFAQGWDVFKFNQLISIGAASKTPLQTMLEAIDMFETSDFLPPKAWAEVLDKFSNAIT